MTPSPDRVVENHPYDRGYWARYDGQPRPKRPGAKRDGWDQCDAEIRDEARCTASETGARR